MNTASYLLYWHGNALIGSKEGKNPTDFRMDERWSKPIKGWLIMSPCPVHSCIHPSIGTHDQGESIGTESKTCTQRGTDTLIPNTFLTLFFDNQSITIDRVAQFFFLLPRSHFTPRGERHGDRSSCKEIGTCNISSCCLLVRR